MKSLQDTIEERLNSNKLLNGLSVCGIDNTSSADEILEYLQERINEEEVIYTSRADDMLSNTLNMSSNEILQASVDNGVTDVETLATILMQEKMHSELHDLDIEYIRDEWLDDYKRNMAREFVKLHRNPLDEWSPLDANSEEEKLDAIYDNLINWEYGDIDVDTNMIEVSRLDSKTGMSVLFEVIEVD